MWVNDSCSTFRFFTCSPGHEAFKIGLASLQNTKKAVNGLLGRFGSFFFFDFLLFLRFFEVKRFFDLQRSISKGESLPLYPTRPPIIIQDLILKFYRIRWVADYLTTWVAFVRVRGYGVLCITMGFARVFIKLHKGPFLCYSHPANYYIMFV